MRYFIRNDDVGPLTETLRSYVDLFLSRKIPVSYQIIPARFTKECADYLTETWLRHPELIEFGQHGLKHQMHLKGRQLWREFGPERSYDEQLQDIMEGRAMLAEKAPRLPITVFTPPQHKYDGNTIRAVSSAGFKVFSGSCYPTLHHRLAYAGGRALRLSSFRHHGISYHGGMRPEASVEEVSIAIAVDNGGQPCVSPSQLPNAVARAATVTDTVGLMFHHEVYADDTRKADLAEIADSLLSMGPQDFVRLSAIKYD